ncbi:hypothetical protein EZL74_08575 [Flavobacterium silvisoli]|uniref:Secreted protein n=1 Tax=Flavobacterium silvisoli TaxID=2529433 RepID=A0A4Q9YX20_9FLAO|nr:hypothetical protein [Flavobacterium silvisoli]TBX68355.1 hypothetical protein EZL74_08575 [Flavobacterium silvisoli]
MKRFSKFIPMAVLALGLVGALSSFTTSKNSKLTINIPGFVQLNPQGTQCSTSIMCSDDVGPLCTFGGNNLWGKDASGNCVVKLYRNHQ